MRPHNRAVFNRNLFLTAAVACTVATFVLHPEVLALLVTRSGLLVLAFIVGAGFFGALGVRELGQQYLPGHAWPWYIRPGGWFFVPVALFCVTLLGGIVYLAAVHITGQRPIEPQALGALFLAAQLTWIVVLDWPSTDRQQHRVSEKSGGGRRSFSWPGRDDASEEER
ncbi:MAG: hypothetical protein WBD44_02360 [Phycisphaerae bacterium]